MPTVTSADGTTIAYESTGSGPPLVLVDGAMCHRAGPLRPLAAALSDSFTVHTYDRRGRGESTDTAPYAPAREIEDLQAVIAATGGRAFVYGNSSGGMLALLTAAAGEEVAGLAIYELPLLGELEEGARLADYTRRLNELLADGRRGDAVAAFLTHIGLPPQAIDGMRASPGWASLEAIAPTLAYDDQVMGDSRVPRTEAERVSVPALVLSGGASPQSMQQAAKVAADALPTAEHRTLEGQTHDVAPEALAPVLAGFFGTEPPTRSFAG